ncbi:putative PurR-regulated permease PerM [Weissella uvarum]|uniref:AI-2E family transporter n=1 Tax=Weissella uvarum TaxID=1479233 RepID=UPI00195FAB1B|nr:AI-2E family transporter [Weissella uvarum]MBM7616914.1 putative PurR-regulated permease PerM [Weissella uvarum]MCM0594635.1 AI-2E family transporter [Weissella uvarum]
MERLKQSKLLFWTLEVLAIVVLIWVLSQLQFLLQPIGQFIGAVFVPLLLSGFLYYLMNPLVKLLNKVKLGKFQLSRGLSVAIVMILFLAIIALAALMFIPSLVQQLTKIVASLPSTITALQHWLNSLNDHEMIQRLSQEIDFGKIQRQVQKHAGKFVMGTANSVGSLVGTLTTVVVTAITVPVMTIYMLLDGNKLSPFLQKFFAPKNKEKVADILQRLDKTISNYISGQAIEMLFVGVFTTIGYFLIGQEYALLLGVVAGLTNMIPYVGPYIGYIPAAIVALMQGGLKQFIFVTIIVLVVQQIDSNVIYPKIIGNTLQIHPLTILVLLLAAGNIAGIPGMILAVPAYAIVRTLVVYAWQLWKVHKSDSANETAKTVNE